MISILIAFAIYHWWIILSYSVLHCKQVVAPVGIELTTHAQLFKLIFIV